jgi:hypothetical protein
VVQGEPSTRFGDDDDDEQIVHCLQRVRNACLILPTWFCDLPSPVSIPKPSTHRMHDPGSIVPHIRPKVFTDNQMSQIKYYYYINTVSKDYDDS